MLMKSLQTFQCDHLLGRTYLNRCGLLKVVEATLQEAFTRVLLVGIGNIGADQLGTGTVQVDRWRLSLAI